MGGKRTVHARDVLLRPSPTEKSKLNGKNNGVNELCDYWRDDTVFSKRCHAHYEKKRHIYIIFALLKTKYKTY